MCPVNELKQLLATMQPMLHTESYVFCSVPVLEVDRLQTQPLGIFKEDEGTTIIAQKSQADSAGLSYSGTWACISLMVYSSLNAVGFLAEITRHLADALISVNAVSAYHHDHLFIPWEDRLRALEILQKLTQTER